MSDPNKFYESICPRCHKKVGNSSCTVCGWINPIAVNNVITIQQNNKSAERSLTDEEQEHLGRS